MSCLVCARLPGPAVGETFELCGAHAARFLRPFRHRGVWRKLEQVLLQVFTEAPLLGAPPALRILLSRGPRLANPPARLAEWNIARAPVPTEPPVIAAPCEGLVTAPAAGYQAATDGPTPAPRLRSRTLSEQERAELTRRAMEAPRGGLLELALEFGVTVVLVDKLRRKARRKADGARERDGTFFPRDSGRAERRAREYFEQLVREGWAPDAAKQRARATYGLEPDSGEVYEPSLPEHVREQLLIENATARCADG